MNHLTHSPEDRKKLMLEKARKVHGDKYDYTKVVYKTAQVKIEIVCPSHGPFWQSSDAHVNGRGCPACGREKSKATAHLSTSTQEEYLEKVGKVHGNYYSYDKTKYLGRTKDIIITCPVHGDFQQKASNHLIGAGCPICGIEKAHAHYLQTTNDFITKSKKVHGDKYDYSISEYKGKDHPVIVNCKTHGPFLLKKAHHHYLGHQTGCPKCSMSGTSKQEQALAEYVASLFTGDEKEEILFNTRTFIKPLELDILVQSRKIAIEYNGSYWHSTQAGKSPRYHLEKTKAVESRGYQLIHVMEYEWINYPEIVKARLAHILGKADQTEAKEKYFARKLHIKPISKIAADVFFRKYHIQGTCAFAQQFALYNDKEEVVACMSFGRNRFSVEKEMELIRYATKGNVVGGFSKLLAEFKRNNPKVEELTSYSDKRWSQGNVYQKSGFVKVGESNPGYCYVSPDGERLNRVSCQKHKLPLLLGDKFDPSKSETKNMASAGYAQIYDCGMDKWSLKLL